MISIPKYEVKEASRVYGDMAEKVAFNVNIDPASILGAMAGGYVANRVQNKVQAQQQEEAAERERQEHTIENGYYSQVSNILANLKIVFTPINVVYSVGGQVFEIIGVNEMTPEMKSAFFNKDSAYFRNLLVNKMNMELQLAEQAFSRLLLSRQAAGTEKQAGYLRQQSYLLGVEEEDFGLMKTAAAELSRDIKFPIAVNFDGLRPFAEAEWFFNPEELSKVAGIFDYFSHKDNDILTMNDLENEVNVGFLPDRVVFLHQGQLLEQLPVLYMNEEGFEAFQRKDKPFFLNFFNQKAREMAAGAAKDVADHAAQSIGKEAADLEDVVINMGSLRTYSPLERPNIHFFTDTDIHPMMYDKILGDRYGKDWAAGELEALLKQIELDFGLSEQGLGGVAVDKIGMIFAAKGENSSVFVTPLTFEKFIRAMNGKDVDFSDFQGNIEFEEMMFGLDVAKSLRGDNVYDDCHTTVTQYVSEELFNDAIRFISDQLYDENNASENSFFDSVNSYVMRKWKEFDAHDMIGEEAAARYRVTEMVADIGRSILQRYADRIAMEDVYGSVAKIVDSEGFLAPIQPDFREAVRSSLIENLARHVSAAVYLELKKQELILLNEKWEEVNQRGV